MELTVLVPDVVDLIGTRCSREAAKECSPLRKPWVTKRKINRAPAGPKESLTKMTVHWLEQTEADVPAENQWLNANEILRLNPMRIPKRRTDWRLGRWTAKQAVAACLNLPTEPSTLADIEIRAASS